jgi:hypothetical protein
MPRGGWKHSSIKTHPTNDNQSFGGACSLQKRKKSIMATIITPETSIETATKKLDAVPVINYI